MAGIDATLDKLKVTLQTLSGSGKAWDGTTYLAYGRCHRNERGDTIIPEIYNSTSKDYQDVLLDDFKDGISFFDVEPERGFQIANVNIYFAVNLKALYPLVTERADEYALRDTALLLRRTGAKIEGITTGLAAYVDFELTKRKADNMQPYFLFRFETIISYNLTC